MVMAGIAYAQLFGQTIRSSNDTWDLGSDVHETLPRAPSGIYLKKLHPLRLSEDCIVTFDYCVVDLSED